MAFEDEQIYILLLSNDSNIKDYNFLFKRNRSDNTALRTSSN